MQIFFSASLKCARFSSSCDFWERRIFSYSARLPQKETPSLEKASTRFMFWGTSAKRSALIIMRGKAKLCPPPAICRARSVSKNSKRLLWLKASSPANGLLKIIRSEPQTKALHKSVRRISPVLKERSPVSRKRSTPHNFTAGSVSMRSDGIPWSTSAM